MRRAKDVLDYLKLERSKMLKHAQLSTLQKERIFYESRYKYIDEIIKQIEAIINEPR